jgi:hypothetical protein
MQLLGESPVVCGRSIGWFSGKPLRERENFAKTENDAVKKITECIDCRGKRLAALPNLTRTDRGKHSITRR